MGVGAGKVLVGLMDVGVGAIEVAVGCDVLVGGRGVRVGCEVLVGGSGVGVGSGELVVAVGEGVFVGGTVVDVAVGGVVAVGGMVSVGVGSGLWAKAGPEPGQANTAPTIKPKVVSIAKSCFGVIDIPPQRKCNNQRCVLTRSVLSAAFALYYMLERAGSA